MSENNNVWGVNSGDAIYMRVENKWQNIGGRLKCVSAGQAGVWGVNAAENIYYRTGTHGDLKTGGTGVR